MLRAVPSPEAAFCLLLSRSLQADALPHPSSSSLCNLVKCSDVSYQQPEFEPWFLHLLAVCPQKRFLTSLCLSFSSLQQRQ